MEEKMPSQAKTKRSGSRNAEGVAEPGLSRSDRKRADIVAAAKEVFFAAGYAGASMDEITARSGVSKATVYAYYRSKDELLLAVVESVLETIRAAMTELPEAHDFRVWLLQLGHIASRQITSPDAIALMRIAITEATRFPEIARAFQQSGSDAALAGVAIPVFEAAMSNGVLRKGDPALALSHFFEMCFAKKLRDVLMGLAPIPSEQEIELMVRLGVGAFLDGYAAKRPTAAGRKKDAT
jgi:AcrR family transcriptional regulator